MIYKPDEAGMWLWDPSIIYHRGKYYAVMMYGKLGAKRFLWTSCLLASSPDGVHWKDEGEVLRERELSKNADFYKPVVQKIGNRFILNHGVNRPHVQDTLRFYESRDLRSWTYIKSTKPDRRWYIRRGGRWDAMYMLPKDESDHSKGFWGYPTAVPKGRIGPGVGMMQTTDGRTWEVLPPAKLQFGGVAVRSYFEHGGVERIRGKYVLIGGAIGYLGNAGYSMFTFTADAPTGPFCPDSDTIRLCGTSSKRPRWGDQLAFWVCGKNREKLISNYRTAPSGVWMLPLRKPHFDGKCLRLGWWKGNEKLKGNKIKLKKQRLTLSRNKGPAVVYLPGRFDCPKGIILEGKITVVTKGNKPAGGFSLDEGDGKATAILLGVGSPEKRQSRIGKLRFGPAGATFRSLDVTGKGCATVRGLDDSKAHRFRLLVRLDMFELYIDDLLQQTFVFNPGRGRIGIAAREANVVVKDLKMWEMSLSEIEVIK